VEGAAAVDALGDQITLDDVLEGTLSGHFETLSGGRVVREEDTSNLRRRGRSQRRKIC
jgi:hypothetical protein